MNRRTLFKTLFGAGVATSLGLEKAVGSGIEKWDKGIIYAPYMPIIKESFPDFFKRVNGFDMNFHQWHMYHDYLCPYLCGHTSFRKNGATTFLATLAHYESYVNSEIVYVYCGNERMVRHYMELISKQRNLKWELSSKYKLCGSGHSYGDRGLVTIRYSSELNDKCLGKIPTILESFLKILWGK